MLPYHGKSLALGLVTDHCLLQCSVPGRPRNEHLCPDKGHLGRVRVILKKTGTESEEPAASAACPSAGRDEAEGICPASGANKAGHWLQQSSM